MTWGGPLYVAVQNEPPGLYIAFGTVGALVEVGAIPAAAGLAFLVRERRSAFHLTLAAAIWLAGVLLIWWLLIAPANAVMAAWTPETVPADWTRWRDRWEYTHAVNSLIKLIAFGALVASVLSETPDEALPGSRAARRRERVGAASGRPACSEGDSQGAGDMAAKRQARGALAVATGLVIGVAVGLAIGVALGYPALGISIGSGLGVAIGADPAGA